MDAGFLHDKAAMLRDMIKTHPVTQAWSVSSSLSLFTGNLLSHSSPCNHNVLLFEALMSNFLFLQSMNKVKYNQESTHHFIVLHDMFFDGWSIHPRYEVLQIPVDAHTKTVYLCWQASYKRQKSTYTGIKITVLWDVTLHRLLGS